MQALQNRDLLSSDTHAMDQLQDFLRQRRDAHEPVEDLDAFEQELHRLFVAAEREALGQELSRFDLDVPTIEVDRGAVPSRLTVCNDLYQCGGPCAGRAEPVSASAWRACAVPSGTARRDHRGLLDPVGGEAGHLGGGAFDAQGGGRTL